MIQIVPAIDIGLIIVVDIIIIIPFSGNTYYLSTDHVYVKFFGYNPKVLYGRRL
jgi:hypothetical protein